MGKARGSGARKCFKNRCSPTPKFNLCFSLQFIIVWDSLPIVKKQVHPVCKCSRPCAFSPILASAALGLWEWPGDSQDSTDNVCFISKSRREMAANTPDSRVGSGGHSRTWDVHSISRRKRVWGDENGGGVECSTRGVPKPEKINQIGNWICAYLPRNHREMTVSLVNFKITGLRS